MQLEVTREMRIGTIRVQIQPDKYPEDEVVAHVAFREDDDSDSPDYILDLSPEEWGTLKHLIDETFRHMQTYIERLPDEDKDEDDE